MTDLLRLTDAGLYCEAGDFFIDPWKPVARAVITHAHADHARPGSASYLCASEGALLLEHRLPGAAIQAVPYGDPVRLRDVEVSLHPAGHIRGSAQVRVSRRGEVWVVTGDYKRASDPTATPFELVRCDTLVTEATFALPVYRWRPTPEVVRDLIAWIRSVTAQEACAVLLAYSLGKAQRLLAELGPQLDQPVWVHGAVDGVTERYRASGVALPPTRRVADHTARTKIRAGVVIAPPSANADGWLKRFHEPYTAVASGWMRVRGTRRLQALDRGFAISDHVDWPALLQTIDESGATRVLATHGDSAALVRYLRERGLEAASLRTDFGGDEE